MDGIFQYFNFATDKECEFLTKSAKEGTLGSTPNSYWDNMVLNPEDMPSLEAVDLMNNISLRQLEQLSKDFKITTPVYRDTMIIGVWEKGKYLAPHRDNQYLRGQEEIATPWRHYTATTYLNDDYEGGKIDLPDQNKQIKPKKGQVILFQAGEPHGVTKIRKGVRYTMLTWFTHVKEYDGVDARVEYCRTIF